MSSARTAAKLDELIESNSQKVAMEAVKTSLQAAKIIGNNNQNVSVNVGTKAGWIIDLSEPGQPEMKIVSGEAKPVEGASPLVE